MHFLIIMKCLPYRIEDRMIVEDCGKSMCGDHNCGSGYDEQKKVKM